MRRERLNESHNVALDPIVANVPVVDYGLCCSHRSLAIPNVHSLPNLHHLPCLTGEIHADVGGNGRRR